MSVLERLVGISKLMSTVLLIATSSAFAIAQEEAHLDVTTTVQKEIVVVNDAGKRETQLVEANTVVPGEIVVYTIRYRNISTATAQNIVITNPIDTNLTYVDGSAYGPGTVIEFSVDGGSTWGVRDDLTVAENGRQRPAAPKDFTHVRWTMREELAAGAEGLARFAAVLD